MSDQLLIDFPTCIKIKSPSSNYIEMTFSLSDQFRVYCQGWPDPFGLVKKQGPESLYTEDISHSQWLYINFLMQSQQGGG